MRNQGTSAAALSELQIWVGSEAQGTSHPVPALEAGATFEVTRTVSLSADSYRTIARADHTGVVVEVDEANNENFLDFNVIPSELVAHRVVYSSDETGDDEIFALALDSNLDVLFKYNLTNRTKQGSISSLVAGGRPDCLSIGLRWDFTALDYGRYREQ